MVFVFERLLAFVKVCLVQFVDQISKSCCGTFDMLSKLAPKLFPKAKKIEPMVPGGSRNRSKGVPPPELPKTRSEQNTEKYSNFGHICPKWNPHRKVLFSFVCYFSFCSASFLGWVLD